MSLVEYTISPNKKRGRSFSVTMLGSVWIPDLDKHPAMAVWISGVGDVTPLVATVRMGREWIAGRARNIRGERIQWPKSNPPEIYTQSIESDDGLVDHVQTIAVYREQFAVRGTSDQFVVLPTQEQLIEWPPEISDGALDWVRARSDYGWENDRVRPYFPSYADLLTTYLASRTRWPVMLGATCRLATLAKLLSSGLARWQYSGYSYRGFRSQESRFHCPGMYDLGYADGLCVHVTEDIIESVMQEIPMRVAQEFGPEYVSGEMIPKEWTRG